jgi:phage replication O-like protein O
MNKGKPDLENGYFRLSNEFYDALLIYKLNQTQRLVMDALIRKLWGWQKKEDDIALSQLATMTRLKEPHISIALNDLAKLSLITKKRGRYGQFISINKYYRSWHEWDISWEYWTKDSAEQDDTIIEKTVTILTTDQIECWEIAKKHPYWQGKVVTQDDFMTAYQRPNSGLKKQYKDGSLKIESEKFVSQYKQRMSRLEEKNNRGKTIKRKSFLTMEQNNEKIIEGEVIND